ncbi:AraC family transcriptional regulator [Chryseobacterium sp. MIQD13]|uniref:AraC family transcriptional regulator n=1 Tax=Chryseobacterium sp. MIQD13 TaxID=3422310 RepID=UPI003D26D178
MEPNDVYYIEGVKDFLKAMNLSHFQKHPSFHILKFEDHFQEMPKKVNLHSHNYFEISFVTHSSKGSARLKIEDTTFQPKENSLTFVAPGQKTYVEVEGSIQDGKGFLLVFTADFLQDISSDFKLIKNFPFFNVQVSPIYYLDAEYYNRFLQLMNTMYDKFNLNESVQFDIIMHYLHILLLEILNLANHNKNTYNSRAEEVSFLFENLLKQTPEKHQPIRFYADKLHVSSVYLSECVKKVTKLTVKQLIDKYIIMEAKSLLEFSDLNIGEIAHQLGFGERSNFINYFKTHTQLTPRQFQKNQTD